MPVLPAVDFHHQAAGAQLAAFLRFQDHLPARAILYRAARIHELGLAENGAAGRLGRALSLISGVWPMASTMPSRNLHGATLVDPFWGDKAGRGH